ncbi:hypothetical protein HC752_09345 [Vibrio sp. S9_S30]|uniref:hypothetical protein n=1 Tax=Vibrio sp. S9_S30 TaxID=2720226 RepID=UPI0016812964|nr:hypothetical protein [Vibrio sp. S9_S30]MBD1557144.1 hypothetical protein [Vibrio sp. S9_S30]
MVSPSKWLASLITGVWLSPFLYIAQGFLGGFGWEFSALAIPLLLISQLYLFYTCILKRQVFARHWISIPAALAAWLIVGLFIAIISSVNLMVGFEQLGLISSTTLVGCLIAYVSSIFLPTPLEKHLAGYNIYFVIISVILSIVTMVVAAAMWLTSETQFF